MTRDIKEVMRYDLLPGDIYIAPGDVPKERAADDRYYAGPTSGALEMSLSESVYPVRDMSGSTVCELHCGARLEVKGKLAYLTPAAIEHLFGAKRGATGGLEISSAPAARSVGLTVLCPIRGESDMFSLYMKASAADASATLNANGSDEIAFSLVSERDFGNCAARLSLCAASDERRGV